MTPYSRFRLVSNIFAAALVIGAVCALWPVASGMVAAATGGLTPSYWAAVGGTAAALVIGWMLLTELILPLVFHFAPLRRMILGRDFAEGTWLQAERGAAGEERITVLRISPAGFGFKLSGHTFGPDFQVDSNRMVEFSAFDGPMLRYVYRSLMPDGAGNQPHALSELAFDRIRSAPKSYLGFIQATGSPRKVRVEGVKLTKWSDRRRLRKADQRAAVLEQYWDVFFGARPDFAASMDTAAPPTVRRPVIVPPSGPAFTGRHNEDAVLDTTVVVPRRRASDWRSEDLTPTADRIRARMIEDEDLIADQEFDEEIEDAEDEVMLEDLYEDAEDDIEDEADEIDADADEEECAQDEEEEIDSEEEYGAEIDEEEEEDLEEELDADAEDDPEDAEEEEDDTPVLRRNRFAGR